MTVASHAITLLALAGCILLTGCAAIVSGTEQTVTVETPGCTGARCKLVNEKGVWYVTSTPGSVTVHRAAGALTVTCTKEGMKSDSVDAAESVTKGIAFGNILLGGIIGAGVDVGTGAAYEYPQVISIPMDCSVIDASTDSTGNTVPAAAGGTQAPESAMEVRPADADECMTLQRRIEAAHDDAFTREVLESNYRRRCGTWPPTPNATAPAAAPAADADPE